MTPLDIAIELELLISDYDWGYSIRFKRMVDRDAFMDLCDEQGSFAIVPSSDSSFHRVSWYDTEESQS